MNAVDIHYRGDDSPPGCLGIALLVTVAVGFSVRFGRHTGRQRYRSSKLAQSSSVDDTEETNADVVNTLVLPRFGMAAQVTNVMKT